VDALYLDTHVAAWLFGGEVSRLSGRAVDLIETSELLISPMAVLELEYLYEIGRLRYESRAIMDSLGESIDLRVSSLGFDRISREAIRHTWTRDLFDRLIVANTVCGEGRLLTMDRKIHAHFDGAVW